VERRRSSQSEGGSDTHQLRFVEVMGFAKGSTHPTARSTGVNGVPGPTAIEKCKSVCEQNQDRAENHRNSQRTG